MRYLLTGWCCVVLFGSGVDGGALCPCVVELCVMD
jgi:hypothetical protein